MGVIEIYGPFIHLIRGTGQDARLSTGTPPTYSREEGSDGWPDSTWPHRPADSRAGFWSVVLAGSPLAVP